MRVTVAEDDPVCRAVLSEFLSKRGHEVTECVEGRDAEAALLSGRIPQLLFLDWRMPEVDGLEVCRRLRERREGGAVHIVVITSGAAPEDILAALGAGANDSLRKPFDPGELEARVRVGEAIVELSERLEDERTRLIGSSRLAFLGRMSRGMAHEINNALAVVQAYASRVSDHLRNGAAALDPRADLKAMDAVAEAVSRISKVVVALREFSADEEDEPFKQVRVREVFDKVAAFWGARLRAEMIELVFGEFPDDLAFHGQENRVCHAILNLVENSYLAVARRAGAWIRLEAHGSSKQALLAVSDSGDGIPPESRARLLSPFFSTREGGKGAGLGLSVAKGIVEGQGGDLWLDSSALNTRFVLTLPAHARARGAA